MLQGLVILFCFRVSNENKSYKEFSSRSIVASANAKIEIFTQRFKVIHQVNISYKNAPVLLKKYVFFLLKENFKTRIVQSVFCQFRIFFWKEEVSGNLLNMNFFSIKFLDSYFSLKYSS